jgi:DNA methylase
MFPPGFVERYVLAFTNRGDIVFDPFCGRGTTIFESLLLGRYAYGVDINPVAVCVSAAKAAPPLLRSVERRIEDLRLEYAHRDDIRVPRSEFFRFCYATETLRQICFLRDRLKWKSSKIDRFVAATALGCLHGESHRTENCFSNCMPRTISTKPDYSIRWWRKRGLEPPERNIFNILRRQLRFRYSGGTADLKGEVRLGDVRNASLMYRSLSGRVNLLITSPPYLDTTDYAEDQWLRLWFLGGDERPRGRIFGDARYEVAGRYWTFMEAAWRGVARILAPTSTIVVRMGGRSLDTEQVRSGLLTSISKGLSFKFLREVEPFFTSEIKNRQTNAFRPGTTGTRVEHDFVLRATR